jgi:hypothetical protein
MFAGLSGSEGYCEFGLCGLDLSGVFEGNSGGDSQNGSENLKKSGVTKNKMLKNP